MKALFTILLMVALTACGQPPNHGDWNPGDGKPPWAGGGNNCFPPPCVPIDGGLWVLLIAAGILVLSISKENMVMEAAKELKKELKQTKKR